MRQYGVGVMRIHVAGAIAAAVMFSSSAVLAADLAPAPVEPVVGFDWTGFSVGIHGGVAAGDFTYPFDVFGGAISGDIENTASGAFAGASIGADYQFSGGFVAGVIADISWSNYENELAIDVPAFGFSAEAGSELEWLATVRGRLGFAWDNLLVYGTGGAAFGGVNSGYSVTTPGPSFSDSVDTDHFGWTAGAGVEYAVTENFSIKTEYLYVDLGDEELFSDPGLGLTLDTETQFHTVKAGISYRF